MYLTDPIDTLSTVDLCKRISYLEAALDYANAELEQCPDNWEAQAAFDSACKCLDEACNLLSSNQGDN